MTPIRRASNASDPYGPELVLELLYAIQRRATVNRLPPLPGPDLAYELAMARARAEVATVAPTRLEPGDAQTPPALADT